MNRINRFLFVILVAVLTGCQDAELPEYYTADVKLTVTATADGPSYEVSISKPLELEMTSVHVVEKFNKSSYRYYDTQVNDYDLGTSTTYQNKDLVCYKGDEFNAFAYIVTPNGKFRSTEVEYTQPGTVVRVDSTKFVFFDEHSQNGSFYIYGSGFPKEVERLQFSTESSDYLYLGNYGNVTSDGSTICFADCKAGRYGPVNISLNVEGTKLNPVANIPGPYVTSFGNTELNLGDFTRVTVEGIEDVSTLYDNWGTECVGRQGNDLLFLYENTPDRDWTWYFELKDSKRTNEMNSGMSCGKTEMTFKCGTWTKYSTYPDGLMVKVGDKAYIIDHYRNVKQFDLTKMTFVTIYNSDGNNRSPVAAVSDDSRYIYVAFYNGKDLFRYDVQKNSWDNLNYSGDNIECMWLEGSKLRMYANKNVATYDTSSGQFVSESISGYGNKPEVFGSDGKYIYLTFDNLTIKRYALGHPSTMSDVVTLPLAINAGRIFDGKIYLLHDVASSAVTSSSLASYVYSVSLDNLTDDITNWTNEGAAGEFNEYPAAHTHCFEKIGNHLLYYPCTGFYGVDFYLWVK